MTVAVTDLRTIVDEADATTDWNQGSVVTADPDPIESTGSLGLAVSTDTQAMYHTLAAAVDMSTTPRLVYVWILPNGTMDTRANGGVMLVLGDGTNTIGYHIAGSDAAGFRHDTGPVGWQCIVVDTGNLPSFGTTAFAGTVGSLNLAAITEIGAGFKTLSKALGGANNCFVDIMRYGAAGEGLRITAGGSGTEGTFAEIAAEDRNTANQKAHGVIREYTSGAYGVQGSLIFGEAAAATESRFIDDGAVVAFESRGFANDKLVFTVEGNSGATNIFQLTGGSIKSAGPFVDSDFSGGNIDTLSLDGVVFDQLGGGMLFSNLADAAGHTVQNCSFIGCGQVDPGDVTFQDNTIQASTAGATGAVLLDADGTAGWSGLAFVGAAGEGHGIYITATGTYDFTNFTFTGFDADETTDAAVYNDSGGAVTINVSGGDVPTVRNGAGASTTVNATVNYNMSGMNDGTEITILDRSVSMLNITGTPTALAFGDASATERMGQSFQVGTTANAERVKLQLRKVGSPTDGVTVRLVNGVPGSALLAESVPLSGANITTVFAEYDIDLTEKNSLTASTTYGIEVQRTGAIDAANYYEIEYDTSDVEASGTRYVYNAGWGTAAGDLLVEIMEAASDNELFHVESSVGTETWQHGGTVRDIEVLALHQDYLPIVLLDDVGATDKDATLTQSPDRVFSNPP